MSANNKDAGTNRTRRNQMEQRLDERKLKILQAIIKNYLETGEPVGSRTISKFTDLNLSSATIRNEMADLEEMGYILQPHTSAGRIRFPKDIPQSARTATDPPCLRRRRTYSYSLLSTDGCCTIPMLFPHSIFPL